MAMITILEPTADAANSIGFSVVGPESPVTVVIHAASGHTAAEYSDVQISHDGGGTWQDHYRDGVQQRLSSTNTAVTIDTPGTFRIAKEATSNATGVYLATRSSH